MSYKGAEAQRQYRRSSAGAAKTLADRRQLRAELRALVQAFKTKPCADCGGTFDPVCMDFDHRPGEIKTDDVSKLMKHVLRTAAVLAEIAKCDLVCSNCHRLRTKNRNHGALTSEGMRAVNEPNQLGLPIPEEP